MFNTSHPATGATFRNRRAELRTLDALADDLRQENGRWLAIIGPRKIGKTSLILELSRRVSDIDVIIIDTQEAAPLSFEFFRTYALRAVDALVHLDSSASLEVVAATGGEIDHILDASPHFERLPGRVKTAVRSLGRARMTGDLARICLDLPERLAEAVGRRVLIAIDEFQELGALASQKIGDPLPLIRSVWQRHRHASYIVSGSGRTLLEEMVSREHSPFFQHFALLYLDPLDTADAVALLTEDCPPDRPIDPGLAARAVAVLGGHPFYLQLFGEALTARQPPYDDAALKEALQELLFSRSGRLGLHFQLQHGRAVGRSTFLAAVLDALADGPKRLADLARAIGAPSADTARYVERLGDLVRKREDGRYGLEDSVFGLWLRWRRPGGTVVAMTVVGDDAEREVAAVLARAGFELVYQARASRGAFDLLATRGAVQLGVQVKRSPLPLRFDRETWNRMKADAERLGWRWVVAAAAPDGLRFLDPGKARRGKELRLTEEAAIENVLDWVGRERSKGLKSLR